MNELCKCCLLRCPLLYYNVINCPESDQGTALDLPLGLVLL